MTIIKEKIGMINRTSMIIVSTQLRFLLFDSQKDKIFIF